ncbi:hypothetical protein [Clavibacter michiganensis]|uniref:hypothetical protein n=1 Tax=Clavibacter michiganensis TaxID=28447 RepID=UPI0026DAF35F|nr:hypothetical protein [Clavibacter michiganensis]MDO4053300.1 hypothetical protein [Clavibacter michiganensis]MDO4055769.1 hypothetical protein [Clavibacter michiganensis]MDO4068061.1 hypothetical protein [Clavibacter michiganensis]
MHEDDDAVSALPVEELRRRVYAQGADETDERWIRAAAELTRRERASRPAAGDAVLAAGAGAGADGRADAADAAAPASADATADDGSTEDDADTDTAASAAPPRGSRRVLVGIAAAALAVGLAAGGAVGATLGSGSAATTSADGTPSPGADAPPIAAGSTPAAAASPDGTTLLGPDSTSDQRSRPVGAIFDGPQEDGDRPPKAVRADVDATTIRAVQTSVGLYAGLSVSGDLCLLVFPSGGAGVVSCASPDRVASDGLRIAWTTEFPSRNRDGSTGMITGDVTATWSGDDLITLTTPDRILAY